MYKEGDIVWTEHSGELYIGSVDFTNNVWIMFSSNGMTIVGRYEQIKPLPEDIRIGKAYGLYYSEIEDILVINSPEGSWAYVDGQWEENKIAPAYFLGYRFTGGLL